MLGGSRTTEIRFELPGLRFEHIKTPKHEVLGFTAVTPQDEHQTRVTQVFYWTMPWSQSGEAVLPEALRARVHRPDHIVEIQNEGLKFNPPQMLIQDADVPALWYYRRRRRGRTVATGTPFVNPVQERTLRWRSPGPPRPRT